MDNKYIFEWGEFRLEVTEVPPGAEIAGIPGRSICLFQKINGLWVKQSKVTNFKFEIDGSDVAKISVTKRAS